MKLSKKKRVELNLKNVELRRIEFGYNPFIPSNMCFTKAPKCKIRLKK